METKGNVCLCDQFNGTVLVPNSHRLHDDLPTNFDLVTLFS